MTWRAAIGGLFVGLIVAVGVARGRRLTSIRGLPRRARAALLVATLSGIVLNLSLFAAFSRVTVALALLAFYTYPAIVTVVVVVRERTRPDGVQLAALGMALLGMTVVVLGSIDPAAGVSVDPVGLGLALVAAATQTVFILVSRHGYGALPSDESVLVILGGGAAGFVALALVAGSSAAILDPVGTPGAWPYLLLGGVVGAGIPTTLFIVGVRRIGGVRTSILAMLEPVTGTILAALVLGETLRPVQVVGGALVIAAGIILHRSPAPGGGLPGRSGEAPDDALIETLPLV